MARKNRSGKEWVILLEFDVPTMHDWNKGNKLVRDTLSGNGCEETGAGTGSGVRDISIECHTRFAAYNMAEKIKIALESSGWVKSDHPLKKNYSIRKISAKDLYGE